MFASNAIRWTEKWNERSNHICDKPNGICGIYLLRSSIVNFVIGFLIVANKLKCRKFYLNGKINKRIANKCGIRGWLIIVWIMDKRKYMPHMPMQCHWQNDVVSRHHKNVDTHWFENGPNLWFYREIKMCRHTQTHIMAVGIELLSISFSVYFSFLFHLRPHYSLRDKLKQRFKRLRPAMNHPIHEPWIIMEKIKRNIVPCVQH